MGWLVVTTILNQWPPNIEAIRKVLPVTERNIFAWHDTIYNPGGEPLSSPLIAHEEVHFVQQRGNPKSWWKKFLKSPEFRLNQELEAHRTEYQVFCRLNKDRNVRSIYLRAIGKRLAHPMYGGMITVRSAIKEIQH